MVFLHLVALVPALGHLPCGFGRDVGVPTEPLTPPGHGVNVGFVGVSPLERNLTHSLVFSPSFGEIGQMRFLFPAPVLTVVGDQPRYADLGPCSPDNIELVSSSPRRFPVHILGTFLGPTVLGLGSFPPSDHEVDRHRLSDLGRKCYDVPRIVLRRVPHSPVTRWTVFLQLLLPVFAQALEVSPHVLLPNKVETHS